MDAKADAFALALRCVVRTECTDVEASKCFAAQLEYAEARHRSNRACGLQAPPRPAAAIVPANDHGLARALPAVTPPNRSPRTFEKGDPSSSGGGAPSGSVESERVDEREPTDKGFRPLKNRTNLSKSDIRADSDLLFRSALATLSTRPDCEISACPCLKNSSKSSEAPWIASP